jgi:hypothetical protein
MRALEEPVQDRVGDCDFAKSFVPVTDGQLRRGDEGPASTVFHDLEKVGRLIVAQWTQQQIVEDQHVHLRQCRHHASNADVSSSTAEVVEQSRHANVECAVATSNGAVSERSGNERFADAGRSNDHHVVVALHPG